MDSIVVEGIWGSTESRHVLGMRVDATNYADASMRILAWSTEQVGRYVCAANVHMTMVAHDDINFRGLVNLAALVVPDGLPLVWLLRRLGLPSSSRVRGPSLMLEVLGAAERENVPIGLYGGTEESLKALRVSMELRFPKLRVDYAFSPPFRPLTEEEDNDVVSEILISGVRILFVGLGCPKQERWMSAHKEQLPLVQLGVGAAFDFFSGQKQEAPIWMQDRGLEWLFRWSREPRRLFKRYAIQNPRFVALAAMQLMGLRKFGGEDI